MTFALSKVNLCLLVSCGDEVETIGRCRRRTRKLGSTATTMAQRRVDNFDVFPSREGQIEVSNKKLI